MPTSFSRAVNILTGNRTPLKEAKGHIHYWRTTVQRMQFIYFQDEFDQLDTVYTEEKKQLNELEERFRTMEKEYRDIMEERRIAREKAEQANRELQAKIKAATLIQSFWRALKARKQLKNKKKKGKKGKKGAKKRLR